MRREPSPLAPVAPDDPPLRHCHECGYKFNPYRFTDCPACEDEE